jgi:hypothetical protein
MYDPLVNTVLSHDLLGLDAMLLRILFKVQIVKQSDYSPELFLIAITKFPCKIPHGSLYDLCMLQMKLILVVLCE